MRVVYVKSAWNRQHSEASQNVSSSCRKLRGETLKSPSALSLREAFSVPPGEVFWNYFASNATILPQQARTRTASFCANTSLLLIAWAASVNHGKKGIPEV